MDKEHCRFLARYNEWINTRLFAVCAAIPDGERKSERGSFFGSIHGTLNHILLGDRIWLGRFLQKPYPATRLNEILYDDFAALHSARRAEDARIYSWSKSLDECVLAAPFTYTSIIANTTREFTLWQAVLHFFNHQTHHRGQLTTLLTQLNIDYGATDMIAMPKDYEPPNFTPDDFVMRSQADEAHRE